MNALKALSLTLLTASQVALASAQPGPSLMGESSDEPQVQAFYAQQCARMAEASGLQGDARSAHQQNCLKNAAAVWPVGTEESEG